MGFLPDLGFVGVTFACECLRVHIIMADQRELARMFLEALFTIGDKQEDSKKVVKSLGTVKTVVEQNLPLAESIATKLL